MGVHDYMCYFCSREGQDQFLTVWGKAKIKNKRKHVSGTGENRNIQFPIDGTCEEMGVDTAHLFLMGEDGEGKWKKFSYSWDDWDFDPRLDYQEFLWSDLKDHNIAWYSPLVEKTIVNVCPTCKNLMKGLNLKRATEGQILNMIAVCARKEQLSGTISIEELHKKAREVMKERTADFPASFWETKKKIKKVKPSNKVVDECINDDPSSPDNELPIWTGEFIDLMKMSNSDKLVENKNKLITEQFELLLEHIKRQSIETTDKNEKRKHGFRIRQINNALQSIKNHDSEITSGKQAQKLDGIGKGSADRIDEILKTGTLQELDSSPLTGKPKIMMELTKIHGIGEKKANDLIDDYDVKGIDDLIARFNSGELIVGKKQLTHSIAVGIKHYYDLEEKIPYDEIKDMKTILEKARTKVDKNLKLMVCGSHRRGKALSGDIDVLIATKEDKELEMLKKFVHELKDMDFLVDDLTDVDARKSKGDATATKYMGVCKIPSKKFKINRRIDIRCVPYDCYAPALLYFTGSGKFNQIMRYHANKRGYSINEYGIYYYYNGVKGDKIEGVCSEKDIFDIVGITYLTPEQREL